VSQLVCAVCKHLWSDRFSSVGQRCGVRLSGTIWCDGVLEEHGCGGPREACGLRNCEECSARVKQ